MYETIGLICDGDLAAQYEEARDLRNLVTVEDMEKARLAERTQKI